MALYAFFSFVAFLLYLQAAIYFFRMMAGTKSNRLFALVLTSLTLVSVFIFTRQFIHDLQVIYLLDRFAVISWISFPLLATYYVTISSGSHINKKVLHVIRYVLLPLAVFLSVRYMLHPQSLKEFYMAESGIWYFNTNIRALWTIMAIIYGSLNTLLSIYVLYQWMKRSKKGKHIKDRIKTRLIFASVLAFAIISIISVIVAPLAESTKLPSLMHIIALPAMTVIFLSAVILHPQAYFSEMISNLFMKRIREFVFYLDHNGKIYSANDYTLEKLGYLPLEMVNKEASVFFKPEKIINQQIEDVAMNRGARQVISLLNPKYGDPITVSLSVTKVYDTFHNMVGFIMIACDYRQTHELFKENKARMRLEQQLISINRELEKRIKSRESTLLNARDKLKLEDRMQQAVEQKIISELKTKEQVLYEIHHRIKNNMQMMISLLNIEQNKKETRDHLRETLGKIAGRVREISVIHDYLYDSPYWGEINFNHFLQKTSDDLKGRFSMPENVFFNISSSSDMMTIDQAIPCGIIVYELLYNSLQHAFGRKKKSDSRFTLNRMDRVNFPAIHIEFLRNDDFYYINITDNGCAISLHDGRPVNKNTGLSLVELLVKDYLAGEIKYVADNGTKVSISFPSSANNTVSG